MTPFKLKGIPFECPDKWEDVTVNQYNLIRSMPVAGDLPRLLSILSGIELSTWQNVSLSDKEIALVAVSLEWMKVIDFDSLPVPQSIKIGDKIVPIPKDLDILPLGCKQYFEQMVLPLCKLETGEDGKEYIKGMDAASIPFALAAYLYKPYTGEKDFSSDDIDTLVTLIGSCKITDAFPIAAFFLRMYFAKEQWRLRYNIPTTKIKREPVLERLVNSGT